MDFGKMNDDELKRSFFLNGINFFGWNSGKNTPNILLKLSDGISELNTNLKAASDSSTRLATALNRLTLSAVVVAVLGLAVGIAQLVFNH